MKGVPQTNGDCCHLRLLLRAQDKPLHFHSLADVVLPQALSLRTKPSLSCFSCLRDWLTTEQNWYHFFFDVKLECGGRLAGGVIATFLSREDERD